MNLPLPAAIGPSSPGALPPDDALREELHNEVHARPSARIRPASFAPFSPLPAM